MSMTSDDQTRAPVNELQQELCGGGVVGVCFLPLLGSRVAVGTHYPICVRKHKLFLKSLPQVCPKGRFSANALGPVHGQTFWYTPGSLILRSRSVPKSLPVRAA